MKKNTKRNKISQILYILFITLSTIFILTTFVNAITGTRSLDDSQSYSEGDHGTENGYLTVQDLHDRYAILCCEHGVHLPSYSNTVIKDGSEEEFSYDGEIVSKPYLTQKNKGEKVFVTTIESKSGESNSPFTTGAYTSETYGNYSITETHIATPMEAYILSEMVKETDSTALEFEVDDDGNTYIQNAWWTTTFGSQGTITVAPNALSEEAQAFEDYIISASGSTDTSTYTVQDYEFTVDGVTYKGQVKAPVIEFNPTYVSDVNDDGKDDEITVSWNDTEQKYLIGPFRVDYLESGIFQFGDRPEVMFSGISDAKLYTDLGEVPADNWEFVWLSGQRDENDDYEYPHTSEVFYIAMDFIEGAKYFENLHFDFKYMNAGGSFDKLEGTYFKATWTPKQKANLCTVGYTHDDSEGNPCKHECSHGYAKSHIESWTYWLELTALAANDSQLLAYGIEGVRWYNDASIDLDKEPITEEYNATLNIKKIVVDEDGNEITPSDNQEFTFQIKINGEVYRTITLKANQEWSKKFTWKADEDAPTYEVEEINVPDGYTVKSISNSSGVFAAGTNNTYYITGYNEIEEHEGYIKIIKKVTEEPEEAETYKFNVYIGGELKAQPTITVNPGETTAEVVVGPFTWNGSTAPTYKVSETEIPENVKLFNMINEKGRLNEGTSSSPQVTVTAINDNTKDHYGYLKIQKNLTQPAGENETYKFEVKINNKYYDTVTVTVPKGETSETVYVGPIKWTGKVAPTYEVNETEIPDGVTQVSISNNTGTLVEGDTATAVEISALNKNDQSAYLVIKKEVTEAATEDETYKFDLYINGVICMQGIEITVPAGQTTASSDRIGPITWTANNNPTYEVKEVEIPANVKDVILYNAAGTLQNDLTDDVVIKAVNDTTSTSHSGTLTIKKVVSNSSSKDVDFTFKITIGSEIYTRTLKNGETWSQKVTWKDGESAPAYSVEEINLPEGCKLVGITNSSGTIKENEEILAVATNLVQNEANIIIVKKVNGHADSDKKFTFTIEVGGETYTKELSSGESWTQKVTWDGDAEAPTYKVSEINLPEGYVLESFYINDPNIEEANRTVLPSGNSYTGTLTKDTDITITATNKGDDKTYSGTITVTKIVNGTSSSDAKFQFKITIGDVTYIKWLANGESWSENVKWIGEDNAPEYRVEEVTSSNPDNYYFVEMKNSKGTVDGNVTYGTMESNSTITVKCYNEIDEEEHQTEIKVTKEVEIDDKAQDDVINGVFKFEITISGSFEMNGESIEGSKKITQTLSAGETYTSPTISWKGDNAPEYSVKEIELPDGWIQKDITNPGGTLQDGVTVEVVCTNQYPIDVQYELTMQMGGVVWNDKALNPDDKNTENSVPNGVYDAGAEDGIEKVEVTIKRYLVDGSGNVIADTGDATAYDEDENLISWPIYTDVDGVWSVAKVEMTALKDGESGTVRYGVEFVYDGQTYTPTTFLTTGDGNASTYMNASRVERGNYFYDSMAIEDESDRADFNSKFARITGDEAIDSDGTTSGYATTESGSRTATLDYISTDSLNVTGSTRKVSSLVTRDSDNYIIDDFKMSANTATGGLTFPFDNTIHLQSINKTIDALGLHYKYKYSATYPYLLSINLGLVEREEAELAATKDVYSAAVVVNQKMLNYEYNQAIDFENVKYQDYLNLQVEVADANVEYELDLYKSDYYYRAAIYNINSEVKGALQKFYKSLGYTADNALENELELDVYVTYKLSVYNDSQSYYATINEIADYFDEDYELVSTDTYRYLQEANGVEVDTTTLIASAPYYEVVNREVNGNTVTWDTTSEQKPATFTSGGSVLGSDGKTYSKITTSSISDEMLASGERINLYLTFKVKTDEMSEDGILNCTRLGEKANVVEIANYSTYNSKDKGDYAGKVDKDSAPNNVNISDYNEKEWYEDDTDSAPIITLELYDTSREINGLAWEDKEDTEVSNGYGQLIGNGIFDSGEQVIGNLTTELWEKLRIKQVDENGNEVKDADGNTVYTDYDFLWPEDFEIQTNKTLKDLTGFDSTTKTSNEGDSKGTYEFTGVPTGNYVVRFVYGDSDETSSPANYDGDDIPAVYNGQDFKTTAYQTGFEAITDSDSDGYVDNEWHNLENDDLANTRVSDARDSESRRLAITSLSRILTNSNTTVLNTANSASADHTDLYNDYYMYAETAKINLSIEDMVSLKKQTVNVTNQATGTVEEIAAGEEKQVGGVAVSYVKGKVNLGNGGNSSIERVDFTYKINNIDVGLEERASTEIKLDKQIENITLTDNTGAVMLNADYIITYTPTFDSKTGKTSVVANAELDKTTAIGTDNLQALNRNEEAGLQNFRYIYYDSSIAQSLTLNVTYKFTVLNLGEVDRIGLLANEKFDEPSVILEESQKLAEQNYSYNSLSKTFTKTANSDGTVYGNTYGKYLGSIYYEGANGKTNLDNIVTTRIDQLIDYVDNNAVFKAEENTTLNNSWRIATIEELASSDSDIIDKNIITTYEDGTQNIEDPHGLVYQTDQRHNIILSVENSDSSATEMSNKDFTVKLVPYSATKAYDSSSDITYDYTSEMRMVMTRSIDAQINDDDLSFDNIAEIVKLDNTAGRRDVTTIAGNSNPKEGEFRTALQERDSSATELITFSPPTGLSAGQSLAIQITLVSIAALGIIAVGIVFIKKKVLK